MGNQVIIIYNTILRVCQCGKDVKNISWKNIEDMFLLTI